MKLPNYDEHEHWWSSQSLAASVHPVNTLTQSPSSSCPLSDAFLVFLFCQFEVLSQSSLSSIKPGTNRVSNASGKSAPVTPLPSHWLAGNVVYSPRGPLPRLHGIIWRCCRSIHSFAVAIRVKYFRHERKFVYSFHGNRSGLIWVSIVKRTQRKKCFNF